MLDYAGMDTVSKFSSQIVEVEYDFAAAIVSANRAGVSYSLLVEPGITVYDARTFGTTVLVKVGEGTAGTLYAITVRATFANGSTVDIQRNIFIRTLPTQAPFTPGPVFGGVLLISAETGEILTDNAGDGISI